MLPSSTKRQINIPYNLEETVQGGVDKTKDFRFNLNSWYQEWCYRIASLNIFAWGNIHIYCPKVYSGLSWAWKSTGACMWLSHKIACDKNNNKVLGFTVFIVVPRGKSLSLKHLQDSRVKWQARFNGQLEELIKKFGMNCINGFLLLVYRMFYLCSVWLTWDRLSVLSALSVPG